MEDHMKISIVGLGLLGGSFSLYHRSVFEGHEYTGVDISPAHARKAVSLGLVDNTAGLEDAVPQSDLVVLATPVDVILQQLPVVLDLLPDGAVLIDFGSAKASIASACARHPKRKRFVSCHPIAGTENSGPEAAFANLLRHKQMIICDQELTDPLVLGTVIQLFRKLDMKISFMDSVSHDRHIAYVSHLSHISSFALGLTVLEKEKDERSIFEMAGSGFSSTVRLAKSSPDMWTPIFNENTENVSQALQDYINILNHFKDILNKKDADASYDLMKKANEIRRILAGIDR